MIDPHSLRDWLGLVLEGGILLMLIVLNGQLHSFLKMAQRVFGDARKMRFIYEEEVREEGEEPKR